MVFSKIGAGRIAIVSLAVLAFSVTTAIFRPEPVSDFLYYWLVADHPWLYHKGGVVGWLFGPAKLLGVPPYWSAAFLNAVFAGAALFAVLPARTRETKSPITVESVLGAGIVVLAVLAVTPAAPLVATDLMAFCTFVIGARWMMCASVSPRRWWAVLGAILAFGLSASLRQVYVPVMLFSAVGLLVIQHDICSTAAASIRWKGRLRAVACGVLIVLGGVAVASVAERSLLSRSGTGAYGPGVVRAVVSIGHDIGDGVSTCGAWSERRARFGLDNRAAPLIGFTLDRQVEVGWTNLPALYLCKLSRLLGFREWFAAWLKASRSYSSDRILADSMGVDVSYLDEAAATSHVVRSEREVQAFEDHARIYASASAWIGCFLQLLVLVFHAMSCAAIARIKSPAFAAWAFAVSILPALVLIGLHAVFFEVQPRYAFPIWLLPPVCINLILQTLRK